MTQLDKSVKELVTHLPYHINDKLFSTSLKLAQTNCQNNLEIGYLQSRLNDLKKQKYEYGALMSFFSELVIFAMLNEKLGGVGKVVFAKEDDNDLKVIFNTSENLEGLNIEVKAIMDLKAGKQHQEFTDRLRTTPTGRSYSIEYDVNFSKSFAQDEKLKYMQGVYDRIISAVQNDIELDGSGDDAIVVKNLNKSVSPSVTAFIGPTYSYWVNDEHIMSVIDRKLGSHNSDGEGVFSNQISKADVIAINVIDMKFDNEDIVEALDRISKIYNFEDKLVIFLTRWQGGKIMAYNTKNKVFNKSVSKLIEVL